MATRLVNWSLNGSVLQMSKIISGTEKDTTYELKAEFDLFEVYPTFKTLSDVQKQIIAYGTKQKLSDGGASKVGDIDGKVSTAKEKWEQLLKGKWTGDRLNATGAADNKRTIASIKETAKVISLEGLVMKKAMASLPGMEPFTEEDEAKLQELLMVAAQAVKK